MPRRVLMVTDSLYARFTAIKRAYAYRDLFEGHDRWSVEFCDRNPPFQAPPPPPSPASFLRRIKRRILKGFATRSVSQQIRRSRDSYIATLARSFNAVYLVKVPSLSLLRQLKLIPGLRVLIDFTDSIWLPWQKAVAWEGLEEMLALADAVICENTFLAEYSLKHNSNVHVVPDCAQLGIFDNWRDRIARDPLKIRLGWIGSPETVCSLFRIWEPLEALCARNPNVELRILGATPEQLPRFEHVKCSAISFYDQDTMVREALAMDIGLFPLFHVTESIGRGNGKAVLYMAAEAATVSEGIGENVRLVSDGVNGVLASTAEEWIAKLEWLVQNPIERKRVAAAGLRTVRDSLSDQMCFSQLVRVLDFVAGPGGDE